MYTLCDTLHAFLFGIFLSFTFVARFIFTPLSSRIFVSCIVNSGILGNAYQELIVYNANVQMLQIRNVAVLWATFLAIVWQNNVISAIVIYGERKEAYFKIDSIFICLF